MAQHISEDDPERLSIHRIPSLSKLNEDANISTNMLFTDDANFYISREVNWQNIHYCSNANPHWMSPTKMQDAGKLMV